MMRKLLVLILFIVSLKSLGQVPQRMNTWGLQVPRIFPDSLQALPRDTFRVITAYRTIPYIAVKNNSIYKWNTSSFRWELFSATVDSSQFATQFDITETNNFCPLRLDTMWTKVLVDGSVATGNGKDNAFPTIHMTPTGKVLVGFASTRAHSNAGRPGYIVSSDNGKTYGAITYMVPEADTVYNYRNLIFSQKGDTVFAHTWSGLNGKIYYWYSVDDWVTISAKDSIVGTVVYATENKVVQFLGYSVMSAYSYSPSIDSCYILYTNKLNHGTWTKIGMPAISTLQLNEGVLIPEGDTLFHAIRSELHTDSMYLSWSVNLTTWSTPIAIRVPEWIAGKPDILRMPDGRWLMNYRTDDGSSPNEGVIAVSKDHGRTWTKLYDQVQRLWAYGSSINAGGNTVLNVHSGQLSLDGTIWLDVYDVPGCDFTKSTDMKSRERFGEPFTFLKEYIALRDSIMAARRGNGFFNPVAISTNVDGGVNFIDNSTQAALAITHRSNSGTFNINNSAAPTVWEQRIRLYDVTATSTDPIIDIGDATTPTMRVYQSGDMLVQKPWLHSGNTIFRIQSNGSGSAPQGSTGVGFEPFVSGGTTWLTSYNRTSAAYAPMQFVGSSYSFFNTGDVTIGANLIITGLTATKLVSTNASKQLISTTVGYGLSGTTTLVGDTTILMNKAGAQVVSGSKNFTAAQIFSASVNMKLSTSAIDVTIDATHYTMLLTATGKTATLPTAVGITGRIYTIKLTASGTGTVATTSSQTIDGSTTYSLASQYKYVTVQSDGSNWVIIANN